VQGLWMVPNVEIHKEVTVFLFFFCLISEQFTVRVAGVKNESFPPPSQQPLHQHQFLYS